MKTLSVKLLVVLLSLVLVLSAACLFASAEETDVMTQAETIEEISTTLESVSEQATVMETVEETNVEDATDAETSEEINFRPAGFVENLKYMAAGMAGIFIVIGAIVLCIVILGKVTDKKKNDEE